MVSSWTVALLFQQLDRYAEVLRRAGRRSRWREPACAGDAGGLQPLSPSRRSVAGYAVFAPEGGSPELLLHPSDARTGLQIFAAADDARIIGGLFTPQQAAHHLRLIREHLLFPDGVRLLDRPIAYRGGPQTIFRRAESSSFFGREIGLMYVHAHLRYAEAMAVLGEADALWDALMLVNPIAVTDRLAQALPRQRNAYFSSSDAAFPDRYAASNEWWRVKAGTVGVEGGWRIYSSGPGIFISLLARYILGHQRLWGQRIAPPLPPKAFQDMTVELDREGRGAGLPSIPSDAASGK